VRSSVHKQLVVLSVVVIHDGELLRKAAPRGLAFDVPVDSRPDASESHADVTSAMAPVPVWNDALYPTTEHEPAEAVQRLTCGHMHDRAGSVNCTST
jgi:hypothetical protein